MGTEDVSEFLKLFSPNSLHYRQPEIEDNPWVFWSQNKGSDQNNSYSADLGTPMIHDRIRCAFSETNPKLCRPFLGQFWTPVTIDGRQLLTTSGQPFIVFSLKCHAKEKAKYRLYSEKYKYNIDTNKVGIEGDHIIISGGPAKAFLKRLPYIYQREDCDDEEFDLSFFIPICFPSQSSCIGVLEFAFSSEIEYVAILVPETIRAIKEAGLDVNSVQDLIPYKTINGLELAKAEIEEALKVVCESHNLALAQVWIAYEDKSHVLSSSPLEDTQRNRLLAIKLTGYLYAEYKDEIDNFIHYFSMCDVIPRGLVSDGFPVQETLQDYGSRYISLLNCNTLVTWDPELFNLISAFAICLRSNNTGNFNYTFEFLWTKQSNYINCLEAIILTLKRCLPSYKFATGIELGDELDVIVAQSDTESDTDSEDDKIGEVETFKIFRGKRSTPMQKPIEEGTKAKVGDYIAPSSAVCKTTPKVLPRIVIEEQFGKTMKEAANNLKVSLSTLKRRVKDLHIQEWPGPNYEKKKTKTLSIDQINTNKEDNGAIWEPSAIKLDQDTLTIKAELGVDMIKFCIPILQATFFTLVKEIGESFHLSLGTFKLNYRDEVGDWILLRSDKELSYCIESSRKMETNEVRLRVLPFT